MGQQLLGKVFRFYDSSDYGMDMYGPYFSKDVEKMGGERKIYVTEEELLRFVESKTLIKRIMSAKEGTKIKLHYLHSTGDLYIERISQKEVDNQNQLLFLQEKLKEIRAQIKALIPKDLIDKERALVSMIKKRKSHG